MLDLIFQHPGWTTLWLATVAVAVAIVWSEYLDHRQH